MSYCDISYGIPLQPLADQDSLEDAPEEGLLLQVISGDVALSEAKIHIFANGRCCYLLYAVCQYKVSPATHIFLARGGLSHKNTNSSLLVETTDFIVQ